MTNLRPATPAEVANRGLAGLTYAQAMACTALGATATRPGVTVRIEKNQIFRAEPGSLPYISTRADREATDWSLVCSTSAAEPVNEDATVRSGLDMATAVRMQNLAAGFTGTLGAVERVEQADDETDRRLSSAERQDPPS